jgi:hypothetical protein
MHFVAICGTEDGQVALWVIDNGVGLIEEEPRTSLARLTRAEDRLSNVLELNSGLPTNCSPQLLDSDGGNRNVKPPSDRPKQCGGSGTLEQCASRLTRS